MPATPPHLSPDGNWWWDGEKWASAKSADGYWQWNGITWVAASTPTIAPLPITAAPHAVAHKSSDGQWWWDGTQWQPVLAVVTPVPAPLTHVPPLVPDSISALMPPSPKRHTYRFILAFGLLALIVLTFLAASSPSALFLVPTVVLGAFFVPVVYVVYLNEIDAFGGIPISVLIKIGLFTALFALPGSFVLEKITHAGTSSLIPAFLVGLIEEGCKLIVLLWFVRRTKWRLELDGIIFGAAAGMAFAAFENIAYAISQFATGGTTALLFTLWLRQILGLFGHGTWTAAIAAVIWREKFSGPGKLDRKVLSAYLLSSALHGLWDYSPLPGFAALAWLLVVGVISLLVLRHRIREAKTQAGRLLSPPPSLPAILGS